MKSGNYLSIYFVSLMTAFLPWTSFCFLDLTEDAICGTRPVVEPRIVGGGNADLGEFPWIAAVVIEAPSGTFLCGGTLISDQWILTAGHCIKEAATYTIKLGIRNRLEVTDFTVDRVIMHPNYQPDPINDVAINDVALLHLPERIEFNNYIIPACLATAQNETMEYSNCSIAGWGATISGGSVTNELQEASVPLVDHATCDNLHSSITIVEEAAICAGYLEGGIDSCQGDSGGPLTCRGADGRWHLVGVTSWGDGCAEPNKPGVYARVSSYIQWIQDELAYLETTTHDSTNTATTQESSDTNTIESSDTTANANIFFPYGVAEGDGFLSANDDDSTSLLPIAVDFPFFDRNHQGLFVNNNGAISFLVSVSQYTPDPFPLGDGRRLLTPFWGDVDTTNGGTVSYREVLRFEQNEAIFQDADDIIRNAFVSMRRFSSSWLFIATWDQVAFFTVFGSWETSIRNSFQAVLVTDGRHSFVIFNYGDINWTTGGASGGDSLGLGGTPAQVGFNAGDGITYYSVPGSRTDAIVDIEETSNIGRPGRWVFRTDSSNIQGLQCTLTGDLSMFPLAGTMFGGTQVLISGPCFNETSDDQVICRFDETEVSGRLISDLTALCVTPSFFQTGRVPLQVSLDGGSTFNYQAVFTILHPEDVPNYVESSAVDSNSLLSNLDITWNIDSLDYIQNVNIILRSYRETTTNYIVRDYVVANSVSYSSGTWSGSLPAEIENEIGQADVGFFGVIESGSGGAALWGSVHVLQWLKGHNPNTWCSQWVTNEEGMDKSFIDVRPSCPCTLAQARLDVARFNPDPRCDVRLTSSGNCAHKQGAVHCVRAISPSELGGGQECCYDDGGFILNVELSTGGGYSHRYHHNGIPPYQAPTKVPLLSNFVADILPWTYCSYFTPTESNDIEGMTNSQKYASFRPSQVCENYVPPLPAFGNGDPHIITLDSTMYTFNGHGEFTLLSTLDDEFVLQARTSPLDGISATVFVAIAARYSGSDIIHIQISERRVLDAYVKPNGEDVFTRVDFEQEARWTYSGVSLDGHNISSDGILVIFDGGVGLELKASEGVMSILLVSPDSFRGQTQGLMGTWNDDPNDDFLTPSGETLPADLTTEEIHYEFGMLWEIQATDSMFFYEPGNDHETHTNRFYLPAFEVVINPAIDQTLVVEVCGTNQFCIFDFQTTGSQSIAQATIEIVNQYEEALENRILIMCPPLVAPPNGSIVVSRYSEGGMASVTYEDGQVTNLICQSNGEWSDAGKSGLSTTIIIIISVSVSVIVILFIAVTVAMCFCGAKKATVGPAPSHVEAQGAPVNSVSANVANQPGVYH